MGGIVVKCEVEAGRRAGCAEDIVGGWLGDGQHSFMGTMDLHGPIDFIVRVVHLKQTRNWVKN